MNSLKVANKSKVSTRTQDLGIKEIKDTRKMKLVTPDVVACRVVFKPATVA
jgi:hypothetical protein